MTDGLQWCSTHDQCVSFKNVFFQLTGSDQLFVVKKAAFSCLLFHPALISWLHACIRLHVHVFSFFSVTILIIAKFASVIYRCVCVSCLGALTLMLCVCVIGFIMRVLCLRYDDDMTRVGGVAAYQWIILSVSILWDYSYSSYYFLGLSLFQTSYRSTRSPLCKSQWKRKTGSYSFRDYDHDDNQNRYNSIIPIFVFLQQNKVDMLPDSPVTIFTDNRLFYLSMKV